MLISIVIIAYNSKDTLVETLDSIKTQTYQHLELIVSDDCSQDNTISIARQWIEENKSRFVGTKVLTVHQNTGTTANLSRGCKAASGQWVKAVAGDDLLEPDAIEKFVSYCRNHNENACVSRMDYFGDEGRMAQKRFSYEPFFEKYSRLDKDGKYRLLLKECTLPGPGLFVSRKVLEEIGFFDESYKFYEEWPTYLKILEAGYDLPYISDRLVRYRCENSSLSVGCTYSQTEKGQAYKKARSRVFEDGVRFYREYRRPRLLKAHRYLDVWEQDKSYATIELITKENKTFGEIIRLYFYRFTSISTYQTAIKYLRSSNKTVLRNKIRSFFSSSK